MRRCLLLLWLTGTLSLSAESPAPATTTLSGSPPVTDPLRVADEYRRVLAQPAYQEREAPGIDTRMRDLLSRWFLRFGVKFDEFKYSNQLTGFAVVLLAALVLLALVGLIYTLVRLSRRRQDLLLETLLNQPDRKRAVSPELYEEDVRRALRAADWQNAWLAVWRQFLFQLETRQLVEADRTRTNREYLAQLNSRSLPTSAFPLLKDMVEAYDRTIYGRREIDEPTLVSFRQKIQEAVLLLHLNDAPAKSSSETSGA